MAMQPRDKNGKNPSKLWYALQYLKMPFKKATRPTVKKAVTRTAIFGASLFVMKTFLLPMAVVPLVGWAAAGVGITATILSGITAYKSIRALKGSPAVVKYIRDQEKRWLEKKSRPGRRERLGTAVSNVVHLGHKNDSKPARKKLEAAAPSFQEAAAPAAPVEMSDARRKAAEARNSRRRLTA